MYESKDRCQSGHWALKKITAKPKASLDSKQVRVSENTFKVTELRGFTYVNIDIYYHLGHHNSVSTYDYNCTK